MYQPEIAIKVEEIKKTFVKKSPDPKVKPGFLGRRPKIKKKTEALRGINLEVPKGQIFGILGPNGAGKTTLIKIISTLILPDEGNAHLLGYNVLSEPQKVRASIGIVCGGERAVYWKLSALENLIFFGRLYKLGRKIAEERAWKILKILQLDDRAYDKVEDLSQGMKMKVNFGRALIHDPPVILLDEPTLGLDPRMSITLRKFIKEQLCKEQHKTILLTSHYMAEVDFLCDKIALMNEGQIVKIDTPQALKEEIKTQEQLVLSSETQIPTSLIENVPGITNITQNYEKDQWTTRIAVNNGIGTTYNIIDILKQNTFRIKSFYIEEPSLEDVFLRYTGRSLSEQRND